MSAPSWQEAAALVGRRTRTDVIRDMARGRWPIILGQLAPELEKALAKMGRHVPCPVHGGKDGFRLFKDGSGGGICATCGAWADGFALLQWVKGWTFPETLEQVASALSLDEGEGKPLPAIPKDAKKPSPEQDRLLRKRLRDTWLEAVPLDHPKAAPVRKYLAGRGLDPKVAIEFKDLRCHPALPYVDDETGERRRFPALLALVRDDQGRPVTIHRTYLSREGRKADVAQPKKLMSPWPGRKISGGAVRLGAPGKLLGVSEGIETALAVIQTTGLPVWPTLGCTFLARFMPPEEVETLVVWADRDLSGVGEEAARELKDRVGIKTFILAPGIPIPKGKKSLDWLDVLVQGGVFCFPIWRASKAQAAEIPARSRVSLQGGL